MKDIADTVKIGITGAAGRMGRRIAALALEADGKFEIAGAFESSTSPDLGSDIGELAGKGACGTKVSVDIQDKPHVVIDFSTTEGTLHWLDVCRSQKIAMVIGTTGLTDSQLSTISEASSDIPIVHAANMSVGVNLLLRVVAQVARALGEDYDIEISETHHRFKKDAPSGTAIALARSICAATGKDYGDVAQLGRGGMCPRKAGEIGMHALRIGDTVGEHTVHFGNLGETITIGHSAHTRDTFVRGALRAAAWLTGKKPGLYSMLDVLGL